MASSEMCKHGSLLSEKLVAQVLRSHEVILSLS